MRDELTSAENWLGNRPRFWRVARVVESTLQVSVCVLGEHGYEGRLGEKKIKKITV